MTIAVDLGRKATKQTNTLNELHILTLYNKAKSQVLTHPEGYALNKESVISAIKMLLTHWIINVSF